MRSNFHPLANLFPMMDDSDLSELSADIAAKGLQEPITRYEGMILDGRNRFRACKAAGIKPTFETYTGKDPTGFVVSKNLRRRQLSETQRAMSASRMATLRDGQHKGGPRGLPSPTQEEAAKLFGVGHRSVKRARVVLEKGCAALVKAVDANAVSVNKAAHVASTRTAEEQRAWLADPKRTESKWKTTAEKEKQKEAAREVKKEMREHMAKQEREKQERAEDEYYAAKAFVLRSGAATEAAIFPGDKPVTKEMLDAATATEAAWTKIRKEIDERYRAARAARKAVRV